MTRSMLSFFIACMMIFTLACSNLNELSSMDLPAAGEVKADPIRGEVIVPATIRHPKGKPCIDDWGQRVQAFAGCRRAAGGAAKFADYFVFLADVETEQVFDALLALGAKPGVHCSMSEGSRRSGLTPATRMEDYLQGDSVVLSVFWEQDGRWHEHPYDAFALEKIVVDGQEVIKPWTPHFVFHGSGAIHRSRTGCIACPCDCPGGIIADNRNPIYDPKPTVRFNWKITPEVGTRVYLRIRPLTSSVDFYSERYLPPRVH